MVSIILHSSHTGDDTQINADRIMYSMLCPEDPTATRVYLDQEPFAVDVRETPVQISDLINRTKLKVFVPDSAAVNKTTEEARARLTNWFKQPRTPK